MALIEPKTRILEDGTEELIEQQPDEEGVEYADLSVDPTNTVEEKPAADKTAAPAAETKPAADKTAAPAAEDDDVPAPLKGKTPGQLAKMYQEAQALIGRQGQELGSYRNKFDQFIQADLAARTAAAKAAAEKAKPAASEMTQEEREAAFFAKPHDAVAAAIENHPIIKKISETLGTQARDQAVANMKAAEKKFYDTHPDAGQIVTDEAFIEWVKSSPVRQELMARAHKRYDFNAGHEVISTWKALQGTKAKEDTATDAAATEAAAASAAAATLAKRKATLKAAGVPTAGASGGQGTPAGGKSGKIFRRADIIDLMENNPERYEAMIDEIQLAYAEKRVR